MRKVLPKCLTVIGAGQMGTGIAIVSAVNAGIPKVSLVDASTAQLENSKTFISKYLEKKGKQEVQDNFLFHDKINEQVISDSEVIIEAATEDFEIKKKIFASCADLLDTSGSPENLPILATNTSSISITKLAASLDSDKLQERVVGMHFMNPVPVMQLVELIPGLQTSESVVSETKFLAESMGKTVSTSRDSAGFIANRILMPYINEAVFCLQENIGSKEEIDKTMKLGCNMPMGPLKLADLIGLDTCLSIMQVLEKEIGEDKYRPCQLLKQYVYAGYLGRKTGKGFYTYDK